jgi:hypothetical protein
MSIPVPKIIQGVRDLLMLIFCIEAVLNCSL